MRQWIAAVLPNQRLQRTGSAQCTIRNTAPPPLSRYPLDRAHDWWVIDMIWESRYWKEPLGKAARYLQRLDLAAAPESVFVRVEREVFFGFYSIRKLFDTLTLTDRTRRMQFDLVWHPNVKLVDCMNWHHVDENYDLAVHNRETRDLLYLCNQFIHSFLFMPHCVDGRLAGFFVASDRERHSRCYFVGLSQVVSAFLVVSKDDPVHLQLLRDEATGQFRVICAE